MDKVLRTAVTAAAIAIAAQLLTLPAQAGPRSAVGAGLIGFGIGAMLGTMMGPPEVYFVPPPPNYYGPVVYGLPHYDGPVAYGRVEQLTQKDIEGLSYEQIKQLRRY